MRNFIAQGTITPNGGAEPPAMTLKGALVVSAYLVTERL
jgi:hypothetical protein